jgi:hypothetical protein
MDQTAEPHRARRGRKPGEHAAPGTPNAQATPSFSRTNTAASTARILAMATSILIAGS